MTTGDGTPRSIESTEGATTGLNRRTVLMAGAWAAPVMAVAAAVPAASASVLERLQFTNFSMWFDWDSFGNRTAIAGCTTVFVEGDPGARVGPVTLVVSVPAANMSTATPSIEENPTVWTASPGVVNGGSMDYTFTYPGTLTAGSSAYTSRVTFHLPAVSALTPPLTWSAAAVATGATSAGATDSLQGLGALTANPLELVLQPGTLARDGFGTLVWSAASITYNGTPQPAAVEYVVELRGPAGGVVALLGNAFIPVSSVPTPLGPITYTAPAGQPLTLGEHLVALTVVGLGGKRTASTAPLVVL